MILVRETEVYSTPSFRMDRQTLEAYDHDAAAFANEWETQPPPVDM